MLEREKNLSLKHLCLIILLLLFLFVNIYFITTILQPHVVDTMSEFRRGFTIPRVIRKYFKCEAFVDVI